MADSSAAEQGIHDGLAFVFLVAFGVVMTTALPQWIPAFDPLRPALVTSLGAMGLMLLARVGQRQPVLVDGLRGWMLVALTVLSLASSSWALNPQGARDIAIDCAKYTGIYIAIVNLVRTPRRLTVLAGSLVLASIVASVGVIDNYRTGLDLVEGFRAHWLGVYADPNRMAMSIGIVVPISVAFFLRRELHGLVRWASLAAGALAVVAIVYSHSRGGFVGLSAAMLLWTARERRLSRWVVTGVAALALLVLAPASFWNRESTIGTFQQDESALGRVHAWTVAAGIGAEKPLLGVGAGSFRAAWPIYAPPDAPVAFEAHDIFLQVLAELGWTGFFLFVLFVGRVIEGAWKAGADPDTGWLARALLASTVGYLVCGLFAGFFGNSPHLFVLFGMAAAAEHLAAPALARAREKAVPAPGDASTPALPSAP